MEFLPCSFTFLGLYQYKVETVLLVLSHKLCISRVFFIEVHMNCLPAYCLYLVLGKICHHNLKWFWISAIVCILNLHVYSNFLLATVFTDINLQHCVQEYGVYVAAFFRDWYFDLISSTSFFIFTSIFPCFIFATLSTLLHRCPWNQHSSIWTCIYISLGFCSFDLICVFRTWTNLLGDLRNNLHISLDFCLTKELNWIFFSLIQQLIWDFCIE